MGIMNWRSNVSYLCATNVYPITLRRTIIVANRIGCPIFILVSYFPGSDMIGWRSDPDCFHRSRVKRLDDWGWQIYNSLQVLRAIDALPQQCNANNKRCTNCRGSCCVRKCLWKDFLDSLVYADSPVESELRGIPIIAEVPTQVVEFIQTCDAGWWSDFVRMLHA